MNKYFIIIIIGLLSFYRPSSTHASNLDSIRDVLYPPNSLHITMDKNESEIFGRTPTISENKANSISVDKSLTVGEIPINSGTSQTGAKIYHVGSIVALVGDGGKIVEENSYDAWGRMRDPETHEVYLMDKVSGLTLGRGYGSHEYLHRLGLVNMDARLYDPVLGRFLSPDPYVQDPTLPQNFNRYSYCLNNPLLYRDPSGEFFLIDDFIIGFFKGFCNAIFKGKNIFKTSWNYGIKHLSNNFKMWVGLFSTDSNKNFWGRSWELFSRFTWQLHQTALGFFMAEEYNIWGNVTKVSTKYGATVITTPNLGDSGRAFTLGCFIIGASNVEALPDNAPFQHEYGHYLQSQLFGPLYISMIAIPSLYSATFTNNHKKHLMEKDASTRGFKYFIKRGWSSKWDFKNNPINPKGLYYWINLLNTDL